MKKKKLTKRKKKPSCLLLSNFAEESEWVWLIPHCISAVALLTPSHNSSQSPSPEGYFAGIQPLERSLFCHPVYTLLSFQNEMIDSLSDSPACTSWCLEFFNFLLRNNTVLGWGFLLFRWYITHPLSHFTQVYFVCLTLIKLAWFSTVAQLWWIFLS